MGDYPTVNVYGYISVLPQVWDRQIPEENCTLQIKYVQQ